MVIPDLLIYCRLWQPCGQLALGPRQPVHKFLSCNVVSVTSPLATLGQKAGLCPGPVLQNVVHPFVVGEFGSYVPQRDFVSPYFFFGGSSL